MKRLRDMLAHWSRGIVLDNLPAWGITRAYNRQDPETGRGTTDHSRAGAREPGKNPKSGHREREHHTFRPLKRGESITGKISQHDRHGNIMECDSQSTHIITGANRVIKPDEVKAFCSVCGNADDQEIISAISQQALCGRCCRTYTTPDGQVLKVSPSELRILLQNHDTWRERDQRKR